MNNIIQTTFNDDDLEAINTEDEGLKEEEDIDDNDDEEIEEE